MRSAILKIYVSLLNAKTERSNIRAFWEFLICPVNASLERGYVNFVINIKIRFLKIVRDFHTKKRIEP